MMWVNDAELNPHPPNTKLEYGVIGVPRHSYWYNYAKLLYVEGQKYTFGDNLTSREEQGEFVFFPIKDEKEEEEEGRNVCEIICKDGKYWVTPLQDSAIFINQLKITHNTQLKFGDVLSFLEKTHCPEEDYYPCSFILEKRQMRNDSEDCPLAKTSNIAKASKILVDPLKSGRSIAENPLIVSLISSYLPLKCLKSSRYVSQLWNKSIIPHLKKKCEATFNFYTRMTTRMSNRSMQIFRYVHEMKNFPIQAWKFRFLGLDPISSGTPDAKVTSDLEWLVSTKQLTSSIVQLHLDGSIVSREDINIRFKILDAVKETLQDLHFEIGRSNYLTIPANEITFPNNLQLPKLQKITLSIWDGGDDDDFSQHNWLKTFFAKIPKVKVFHIKGEPAFCNHILQITDSFSQFPDLVEVSIGSLTPVGLSSLSKLRIPLKKCELNELRNFKQTEIHILEQFLLEQAKTLEFFHISLEVARDEDDDSDDEHGGLKIQFPVFPVLKVLEVTWQHSDYNHVKKITVSFPGSGFVNYAEHLPCLRSLKVGKEKNPYRRDDESRSTWREYDYILQKFFPPKSTQICNTLTYLDAPLSRNDPRYSDPDDGITNIVPKRTAQLILDLFPNYVSNWTKYLRDDGDDSRQEVVEMRMKTRSSSSKPVLRSRKK